MEVTREMLNYANSRLINHIQSVNNYAHKLGFEFPSHDLDKLTDTAIAYDYVLIANNYRERASIPHTIAMAKATDKHVKSSPHHPEYWDSDFGFDRDDPKSHNQVDATKMPPYYLAEMVCDWCAMSEERGNTPLEWFNKNLGIRWKFNKSQVDIVMAMISIAWNSSHGE